MMTFFRDLWAQLLDYLSLYEKLITGSYYGDLFGRYFSFSGFIVGLIFVLLVYFSSTDANKKTGFFKVLPFIAVINSCAVLLLFFGGDLHQGYVFQDVDALYNYPDNLLSGFLLTLVLCSCYRGMGGRAFLFGLSAHIALPLLHLRDIGQFNDFLPFLYLLLRLLLVGFVCLIISHRRYFFTSWIWYFGFHMLLRTAAYFLPLLCRELELQTAYYPGYTVRSALRYFSGFTVDAIAFLVVLAFAIVFEKAVLRRPKRAL